MTPFVIENFFDFHLLGLLNAQVALLKKSLSVDDEIFNRKFFHNHPMFKIVHENMTDLACAYFDEDLKPSYAFLSMYEVGEGFCPHHVDRPQCYRTIDVCLNQAEPWGIFVNHKDAWDENNQQQIKDNATEYFLSAGDALCYSGTDHPHFRNKIQPNNFCDLAFFHFVKADFKGDLK